MKNLKKILAILLAMMLVLSMAVAFADPLEENPEEEPVPPVVEPEEEEPEEEPVTTTGNIKLENPEVGRTYMLYKLFDLSWDGESYGEDGKPLYAQYTTDETLAAALDGKNGCPFKASTIPSEDDPPRYYIEVTGTDMGILAWVKDVKTFPLFMGDGHLVETETATKDTRVIDFGSEPYGWYLLVSRDGPEAVPNANFTLTLNTPQVVIRDKNPNAPGDVKKSTNEYFYQVGDMVPYTVSFMAKNWYTELTASRQISEYVVTETTTDLQKPAAATDFTVTVYNTKKDDGTFSDVFATLDSTKGEFTWDADDAELTIPWVKINEPENGGEATIESIYPPTCYVVINYSMKVLENALYDEAGKDGKAQYINIDNKVVCDANFVNNSDPYNVGEDDEQVHSLGISIRKYELGSDPEDPVKLEGAEFKMFKYDKDGNKLWYHWVEDKPATEEIPAQGTEGQEGYVPPVPAQPFVPAHVEWIAGDDANDDPEDLDGYDTADVAVADNSTETYEFGGLDTGTYWLKEVKAPVGYTPDSSYIECTVEATLDENHKVTYPKLVGLTANGTTTNRTHVLTSTVYNGRGSALPQTGGIGTTIFYVLGGVLLVGAAVLLVTRKRMGNHE